MKNGRNKLSKIYKISKGGAEFSSRATLASEGGGFLAALKSMLPY